MKQQKDNKNINKYLYVIITIIIFAIVNYLIVKGLNIIDKIILIKLIEKYQTLYLIFYNLIWTIINVLELIIIYKFINKMTLKSKDINLIKNINIISYISIITILNIEKLNRITFYNIKLISIMLLLQIVIIWYLKIYIFEKKYKCERLKLDLLSLIISTIITFVMIFTYEYIDYEKAIVICIRPNGDTAYIRVGEYGVENIKIKDEFIKENDLLNYNLSLLVEFANNINKYENKEELIKENIKTIISYEENNNSKCKTIR